jgi:peroxiredoxin
MRLLFALTFLAGGIAAQEQELRDQIRTLRQVPDDKRGAVTRQLALDIRALPKTQAKLNLASGLANLSTEGDFGLATLQEVATTLSEALREQPIPIHEGQPSGPYVTLAQLVRYEGVKISTNDPAFVHAMKTLEAEEAARARTDFVLKDLNGKEWKLSSQRGKVVLVNFWATWCPPCRKEMPDMEALQKDFGAKGLVVLAISDETEEKVAPFVKQQNFSYPILLDPGRKVGQLFAVNGIPKTFIYDRSGKLVATAIDMRTRKQFLALLSKAGLQ